MKVLKPNESQKANAYEVEKDLRLFADITSEGLATLLSTLVSDLEEAVNLPDAREKDVFLKKSIKGLEQALFISRNLRYFSRKSRVSMRAIDISQHVLHILDGLECDFKDQRIELGAFVESGLYSRLDPGALDQILSNLLLYAMASMPKGGKLTVALGKNGFFLEFCISDTGAGLTKEQVDHLFQPYFALHHHAFHAKDRGLGLMVAKALVESEGGELSVRSTLGKGTNFLFKLPYDPTVEKPDPFIQKRRYPRIHLTLPIEVAIPGTAPFMSRLTTLSVGGCYIEIPRTIVMPTKNTLLRVTILSLGDSPLTIENARVAHTGSAGTSGGMGVEFPKLEKKTHKVISAIVKGHR